MQRRTSLRALLAALSLLWWLPGEGPAAADKNKLNSSERKVVDYLVRDWGNDYSVTSVDMAMGALKLGQSDETRFRVGSYIKSHPELHEVIRNWGWVTLVLNPDEKLIARALINAERDGKPVPSIAEIAVQVSISEDRARRGLAMLQRFEIVRRDSAGGVGYKVDPHYLKWVPRLDFLFHSVTLASGRQFNTN